MSRVPALFCCVILLAVSLTSASRLRVHAKLLARAHVWTPPDVSHPIVHAWSPSNCLARCNKKVGADCDGVNFIRTSGTCYLLPRCAPTTIVRNGTDFYFYSKRPQILSRGFHYDPASESCIRVARMKTDYAMADRTCAQQNGRLVTLRSPSSNELARRLLRASGAQYAWIGLLDVGGEGNPTHSDGSRAMDSNFFRPSSQHWRNSTKKNCWALQDDGLWAELSCKTRRLYSICEVPIF